MPPKLGSAAVSGSVPSSGVERRRAPCGDTVRVSRINNILVPYIEYGYTITCLKFVPQHDTGNLWDLHVISNAKRTETVYRNTQVTLYHLDLSYNNLGASSCKAAWMSHGCDCTWTQQLRPKKRPKASTKSAKGSYCTYLQGLGGVTLEISRKRLPWFCSRFLILSTSVGGQCDLLSNQVLLCADCSKTMRLCWPAART